MAFIEKTRKPRNPYSPAAAARKAGKHQTTQRKKARQEKRLRQDG